MNPFTDNTEARISGWGEVRLIEAIREWLGEATPSSPAGIGDDCAVLPEVSDKQIVVSTDALVFGRHFDASHAPESAGKKLLRRNLSDLAAMGAEPVGALVSLALGGDVSQAWLEAFYRGLAGDALLYKCPIMGGDITEDDGGRFMATMTVFGATSHPVPRLGACLGDTVWVTGALGGSLAGRHMHFEPRLAEGVWLSEQVEVRAMMDISDGLGKDLPAMLGEGLSARIDVDALPVHSDVPVNMDTDKTKCLEHVFNDGEDYELLFMLKKNVDEAAFMKKYERAFQANVTKIGTVEHRSKTASVLVDAGGEPLEVKGYTHLRDE